MKVLACLLVICCIEAPAWSQSYAFGLKGGPSLTIQKWSGFSREPLLRWHGVVFIESQNNESNSSLFAQAGYHIRGSAMRFYALYDPITGKDYKARSYDAEFHNISLTLGAKRRHDVGAGNAYYMMGLRGEYTINTKLNGFLTTYNGLENKFLFGALLGAGYELPFSHFVSGLLEFSISPDFTKQIFIPRQRTGYYYSNGSEYILNEQNVTNVSIEVSLGIRFLREITYYD